MQGVVIDPPSTLIRADSHHLKITIMMILDPRKFLQYASTHFFRIQPVLPVYIMPVTRVNQDDLHSVIQFALDRAELSKALTFMAVGEPD